MASYTNASLAHAWAQQNKESGSTGVIGPNNETRSASMSFSGRSIYSYRTEIGRFFKADETEDYTRSRVVVKTNHKYSPTTSSKHYPAVFHATLHHYVIHTGLELRDVPDDFEQAKRMLFEEKISALHNEIQSFKSKQKINDFRLEQLRRITNEAIQFHDLFISDKKYTFTLKLTYADLVEILADTLLYLETKIDPKIREKLDRSTAQQKQRDEAKREKHKLWEEQARLTNEEKIEKWKNGENHTLPFGLPIFLRLKGDTVETSHGASVSLAAALTLYKAIKDGLNVKGLSIDNFTVTEIKDDAIIIGCHTIPLSEIERIRNILAARKETLPDEQAKMIEFTN